MINLTKFGSLFGLHDETVKLKNTLLKTALIQDTKIIIKEFTGFIIEEEEEEEEKEEEEEGLLKLPRSRT